jgi:5'-3' exonuclease
MKKLLIIDASSMLVSHFMATLPMEYMKAKDEEEKKKYLYKIMQTKSGIYTNGVFSMLKAILYLLKNQKPDYICACFDKGRKNTFRKKMYDDYKAQRKETDPILSSQFKLIQDILDQIGIKMFMNEEYEADDFAGSIAEKFKNEVDIYLWSRDQDYLQLVDKNVYLWRQMSKNTLEDALNSTYRNDFRTDEIKNIPINVFQYDIGYVKQLTGVYPEQIVDLKAIVGDTSDNIPGVKGVSDKTAIPLLQKYGTVENIYEAIEMNDEKTLSNEWKEELGIKRNPIKSFQKQKDICYLSKKLATIYREIPIDETLDDLSTNINDFLLTDIIDEYEFSSLSNLL